MSEARLPEFLRPYFWDTDFDQLDPVTHERFIAERLMEKTTPETFRWLMEQYSLVRLQEIVLQSRRLSPRDRHFWRLYLAQL
ncbi:MAG: hypothetical protein NNA18_08580 [Nitrospira sp.]|nr:hypothetical protein [Nitrospira sp.]